MTRYTNLADILRADPGLRVTEEPGWKTRGRDSMGKISAIMLHHTANGGAKGNLPSLRTVRDGRPGIPGPLSQLMVARDGSWHVVASGLANHAGDGKGWGLPQNNANPYTIGIEAESSGIGFDWTSAQLESYPRGVAALCRGFNLEWHRVLAHKWWAPTRKIDPAGWPGDVDGFVATVKARLEGKNPGGIFMALSDADQALLLDLVRDMAQGKGGRNPAGPQYIAEQDRVTELNAKIDTVAQGLAQVSAAVQRLETGAGLTPAELEAIVYAAIDRRLDN